MTATDRALLLADAERLEDHHRAPRDGAALRPQPREHRQGRAVQAGVPARSRRTTGCRRSSTRRGRTARRSRSSSPARSCSTSARKTGRFYGATERERVEIEQWLFWQVGGVGPMAGQAHHFLQLRPEHGPAERPALRQGPLPQRGRPALQRARTGGSPTGDFVAGAYSIADMAIWPWANGWENQQQDIDRFPHMKAWLERVGARPAVQAGRAVGKDARSDLDQGPRGAEDPVRPDRAATEPRARRRGVLRGGESPARPRALTHDPHASAARTTGTCTCATARCSRACCRRRGTSPGRSSCRTWCRRW